MKSNIIKGILAAATLLSVTPAAPVMGAVPASKSGVVVFGSQSISLENNEAVEMQIPTYAACSYAVSGESWLTTVIDNGKLILNVEKNPNGSSRTAMLNVTTANGGSAVLSVVQPGWDITTAAQESYDNKFVHPLKVTDDAANAKGRANSAAEGPELTIDGDPLTIWHTNYSGFSSDNEKEWPVLTYHFTADGAKADEGVEISSITYVTRSEGGANGSFGLFECKIGTLNSAGELVWTPVSGEMLDFKMAMGSHNISIPAELQKNIHKVQFIVHTGSRNSGQDLNFASCAEMQFHKPEVALSGSEFFVDDVFSALKEGTTEADIATIGDPFLRDLADKMLSGVYNSEGLVSTQAPHRSVQVLSDEWNAPGKYYDQNEGVTGVALTPGRYAIIVSGIREGKGSAQFRITYWHGHDQYKIGSGDNEQTISFNAHDVDFAVHNGLNIIDIPVPNRPNRRATGDDMALAYMNNYDDEGLANGTASDIKVHIVGGLPNGVLRPTMTNAENKATLDKAVYPCMDVVGSRTHCIWQTEALKTITQGDWVRLINIYDQLIMWEHRVLGLEKYDRVPTNHTMAYVNYSFYMFQGGRGPSYMYNTQYRTLSTQSLMHNDDDLVWGLSHEWGHQHQMAPYFRWTAMAESSNNIFSAYNVAHMGYPVHSDNYSGRYPKGKWEGENASIRKIMFNDAYDRTITKPKDGETKTANSDGIVMSCRSDAAKAAKAGNAFWWSNELKEFAQNQPMYASRRYEPAAGEAPFAEAAQNVVDPVTALNSIESYSSNTAELTLAPYVNLMYFFSEDQPESVRSADDARPDLWPDLFESLRRNDRPEGSDIEKTGIDKYELLASIFNHNKTTDPSINKTDQFKELYPKSVWTTKSYLPPSNQPVNWQQNSLPYILNIVVKASRLTGYNLWSYFERYGVFTVCALEQGDYGIQHYICTRDMYDEFKADMYQMEKDGILRPLTDKMREAMMDVRCPEYPTPNFPNDRPLLPTDN